MKTTNSKIEASAPANVRPSKSVSKTGTQSKTKQQAFIKHCENRKQSTEAILNYLRTKLPKQYETAEVVGKWVWLEASAKGAIAVTLWLLGFHWNRRRGIWQHPCGKFGVVRPHPSDPRAKYRSYFPADVIPA